jgi:hypothetical protein
MEANFIIAIAEVRLRIVYMGLSSPNPGAGEPNLFDAISKSQKDVKRLEGVERNVKPLIFSD